MLRSMIAPAVGRLSLEAGFVPSMTQVRHKRIRLRKPAWMPRAPSKLFVLFDHPYISDAEKAQYAALHERYENEIRSIQAFFAAEQKRVEDEKSKFSQVSMQEEQDFQDLLRENEEENRRIAAERERRHQEDFTKRMEAEMQKAEQMIEQNKQEAEFARQELQKEMANLHIITREMLDDAVKKAYNEPVSFDFAITLSGMKGTHKVKGHQGEGH